MGFLCRAFGHKFPEGEGAEEEIVYTVVVKRCKRCGAPMTIRSAPGTYTVLGSDGKPVGSFAIDAKGKETEALLDPT